MLEKISLTQTYPARTQRLSEGVFWFIIAATLLLCLLEGQMHLQTPQRLSVAWLGFFALYYALRLTLTQQHWLPLYQNVRSGRHRWLQWCGAVPFPLLLDLLVITGLVALSGGWNSPLYLLYLGWAAALLDVRSTLLCLCLCGFACGAFLLSLSLASHQPFSPLQSTLMAEQIVVLLLVLLGISGINAYCRHIKSAWDAERHLWDVLRQTVFSQLSHELYTPLCAISAGATIALEKPSDERQQQLLSVIERNCARMSMLLDDLLALWKEPQRQFSYIPSCLPCFSAAQAVAQMLSPLLERKQQSLVITAEPQDICVLGDQHRLEQVLVNLLVNAQKYAPAETTITLTVHRLHQEALFAVHDEGPGVPVEEQGRLFDLLYRGTNGPTSSRGSGIGLALAKALVILQGGRIWVESIPGRGSIFYFTLPAADAE